MDSLVNIITLTSVSRECENNFAFYSTGAEPQVISAFMYSDISLELLPTSVGAYGLSLSEYDVTRHCMPHVFQVKSEMKHFQ
jgi:hypothetical protein